MRHQDLTINHRLESWVYANAAARTGATGFVPTDVGRIAFQQDNSTYWRLTDDSPVTWQALATTGIIETWTYANAAARTGATGFSAGDVGKLAYQTDSGQYWRLFSQSGGIPTWLSVAPNAAQSWTYTTVTDRDVATGFSSTDPGRIAFQLSDGTLWMLLSTAPTWLLVGKQPINSSTATVAGGYATDTYLAGSAITMSTGDWFVRSQYHCTFEMQKTAAGVATPIITLRIGTAGTTADTARIPFTFSAGTAVADTGIFEVWATFRSVGSGTSAVVAGIARATHNLTTTGLISSGQVQILQPGPSSGFDSTTATTIGLSFNGGTSFSGVNGTVQARLI